MLRITGEFSTEKTEVPLAAPRFFSVTRCSYRLVRPLKVVPSDVISERCWLYILDFLIPCRNVRIGIQRQRPVISDDHFVRN